MSVFGLRFGSTTACVAVTRDGKTNVVANDAGDRVTPAVVAYTDHEQAVGLAAKQGLIRNAANSVCKVKQVLGRSYSHESVQDAAKSSPARIVQKNGSVAYEVQFKGKTSQVAPVQVASAIFRKMMDVAESHGGLAESHDAVLAVPLHFDESQKSAVLSAATQGDFAVQRVISEPAAALLAYDIGQSNCTQSSLVLVYRLGGTSLDVTLLRVVSGMYRVLADVSDTDIGGHQIEDLLVEHFAAEFQKAWRCDCRDNKRSVAKLRNAAERCKHVLSTMQTAHCSVDSLYEGIDFNTNLSRSRFEMLISSFVQRSLLSVDQVLRKANLTAADVDKVVVCGGCSRIPYLQQQLQDRLPGAELLTSIPPDEVIAMGAAKQAALLVDSSTDTSKENITLPALAADILLQTDTDSHVTLVERCCPVPARCQYRLCLANDQTSACLQLCQRHNDATQPLGKLVLKEIPPGSQLELVLHFRSDGSLHATCTEPTSNSSTSLSIDVNSSPLSTT